MSAGGARGAVERWFRGYWRGDPVPGRAGAGALLAPLSWAYGAGVRLRNTAFDRGVLKPSTPPIPVLSVGNLVVGGTGKTPVTRWIVAQILACGGAPAVVSRGYGADELALHRRWNPGVPVIAAPRRVEGVRSAAAAGATIALVDDGFQHRWLAREVDLVLLAAEDPFPGRLLPWGPFREPAREGLRRARGVFVTARGAKQGAEARARAVAVTHQTGVPAAVVTLQAEAWQWLDGTPAPPPADNVKIRAVTSIARPEGFLALLAEEGISMDRVTLEAFPDHHPFTTSEARSVLEGSATVVMTEKDAVKFAPLLEGMGGERVIRVLSLGVVPDPDAQTLLRVMLRELGVDPTSATLPLTPKEIG